VTALSSIVGYHWVAGDPSNQRSDFLGVPEGWSAGTGSDGVTISQPGLSRTSGFDSVSGTLYGSREATSLDVGTATYPLGDSRVHWFTAAMPEPAYIAHTISGTSLFVVEGSSTPTNRSGIEGTLDQLNLSVDFTRLSATMQIGVTVESVVWSAALIDYPIGAGGFVADECVGCPDLPELTILEGGAAANGSIVTAFTGVDLSGAGVIYRLEGATDVQGSASMVSNNRGSRDAPFEQVIVAVSGLNALEPSADAGGVYVVHQDPAKAINDDNGQTSGVTVLPNGAYSVNQGTRPVTFSSSSVVDSGTDALTGISWGRWDGTVAVRDTIADQQLGGLAGGGHWIRFGETQRVDLPISGSYNYQLAGATSPTNQNGETGVLDQASLSADFTNMSVDLAIGATVNDLSISGSAAGVPITTYGGFRVDDPGGLGVQCSGTGCGATNHGVVSGGFTGNGAAGAAIGYQFQSGENSVGGVAAFRRQ
jgi:hypothetical protein